MNSNPHEPTGDEIAEALRHEIEKLEIEESNKNYKTYTTSEVLAKLYAIRDCE